MLIKTCVIELRNRLRSCNVYITTTVDLRINCNMKINIQPDVIVLNYYNNDACAKSRESISSMESLESTDDDNELTENIEIGEFCRVIPSSMTGLMIHKNDISFRILTESNNGDIFNEIITNGQVINDKYNLTIDVKKDEEVEIQCGNCMNCVSNGKVVFDRVLELPSENLDVSDWFCHGHCSGESVDTSAFTAKPNKKDLLYRLCYVVVNNSVLSEKINKFNRKRAIYHCDRCLSWLGMKGKENSVKLYNSTVKVNNNSELIFKYNAIPHEDVAVSDFIYIIEKVVKEFNIGMQYAIMCKLLLECTISKDEVKYLLLWIMDRELQVLKSVIEDDSIKLISGTSTKILYRVEESKNEQVESWSAEPGVVCTEISKSMLVGGLKHLEDMSLNVPESFRLSNGFRISYLTL